MERFKHCYCMAKARVDCEGCTQHQEATWISFIHINLFWRSQFLLALGRICMGSLNVLHIWKIATRYSVLVLEMFFLLSCSTSRFRCLCCIFFKTLQTSEMLWNRFLIGKTIISGSCFVTLQNANHTLVEASHQQWDQYHPCTYQPICQTDQSKISVDFTNC